MQRMQTVIDGAVQGVGFRPFVYVLAHRLGLAGSVRNTARGVFVEAEGKRGVLDRFLEALQKEKPPLAAIEKMETVFLEPAGLRSFEISESAQTGLPEALILPDIAVCEQCLAEVGDPGDRRYLYPFTNCTHCGPRFSIIEKIPYDRRHTTMKQFRMCKECRREYDDPADRRFHAEPNACPACGPRLLLKAPAGNVLSENREALEQAVALLKQGRILALKGVGGFHLICDAADKEALMRLRVRKHRDEKPFALMFPDIERVRRFCEVLPMEERLLKSPEAPIVLLTRRGECPEVCEAAAPGNPYWGVMLPYTPLHFMLLSGFGRPVVATSGNLSEEPIVISDDQAFDRLAGIADFFLTHDRPIARPVEDSLVQVAAGREMVLRRARGYAPLPVTVREPLVSALAVGGHLKSTVAVSSGRRVFLSPHLGNLENLRTLEALKNAVRDLETLYDLKFETVICDAHPDYLSTAYARQKVTAPVAVQHHRAHIFACMAEHHLEEEVLGVAWDGTGLGDDGTVWGGEFFQGGFSGLRRIAHLRTFPLPGGEKAIREPRRAALGLLFELWDAPMWTAGRSVIAPLLEGFSAAEKNVLKQMLNRGLHAPRTSSAGRLFDAVAALLGVAVRNTYEGQAPMCLEFSARGGKTKTAYPFDFLPGGILDWGPMAERLFEDLRRGVSKAVIAARFHRTLAEMIVAVAQTAGLSKVVLGGGCFQNRLLLEETVALLKKAGFTPYWPRRVPPGDGGLALGQIMAARKETPLCV